MAAVAAAVLAAARAEGGYTMSKHSRAAAGAGTRAPARSQPLSASRTRKSVSSLVVAGVTNAH